jgi:hypothetical protein
MYDGMASLACHPAVEEQWTECYEHENPSEVSYRPRLDFNHLNQNHYKNRHDI